MMTSSLCFIEFAYKTCQRQPAELKLCRLIVHLIFYTIYKFESHVARNDVIMISLPKTLEKRENADLSGIKQNIYHWKGFDESYSKM